MADSAPSNPWVSRLREIDATHVSAVGGKGAHLGELSRLEGVRVPPGFCVTAAAFRRILDASPSLDQRLDALARLRPDDAAAIHTLSTEVRRTIEATTIPEDLASAIAAQVCWLGEHAACAVRSSGTAEDLPNASFAGQHDTYLNVVGSAAILEHVRRCWASLFTERSVTYRLRHGFDPHGVHMAVIVQRMIAARAAGILFTADPVTSNRKVISVEATFGLGEALVSGLVNADVYRVRDRAVVAKEVATKRMAIHASPHGGTEQQAIDLEQQARPVLTDAQIVELADLGRRIEAHFGHPQDIEWCLADDGFSIVQSRPITTLFPIPSRDNRVYVSVGHQQMMTDPFRPLGISVWQLTSPGVMREAGGRLFVDVTEALASPSRRAGLVQGFVRSDPLIADALRTIVERGDVVRSHVVEAPGPAATGGASVPLETDPTIVEELIAGHRESIATLERDIRGQSGAALLDFIRSDLREHRRTLFDPRSLQAIMAAIEATWWLNEKLETWLGEKNAADTLTQSVPHDVTSQMGLALLDVADAIRPHADVVRWLERFADGDDLDALLDLDGGRQAHDAIRGFLSAYGMRCVGEIDITTPRWSERPSALVPVILGHVRNAEPGAGQRRFEQGRQRAAHREADLLDRLRALPDGDRKAEETKAMIDRLRTFMGYREYPKYALVTRYFVYKQALMRDAERLVQAGVLRETEDVFYLEFEELEDVVREHRVDDELIRQRKHAFGSYRSLTPPRVITSEGEVVTGAYRRDDVPAGALVGLAVSAGTVEGRARVVLDLADADLEPGDILVTAYTDPSWTPLFLAVAGVVTEVGGLMTHGAVIAREFGLPAVVGVERATARIRDGQRIRVHGTEGYVEVLG